MTKLIRLFALAFSFVFTVTFLDACTDSDNLIFNEDDATPIQVNAYMSKSFDSTAAKVKYDTIVHGDSLLFIANVTPSKSIRIRDSYWLIDNKFFASEFNVHDAIPIAGPHEIVFVLITYFGDTLSDTLHLWISSPPILDNKKFIPANESQNIPPQENIQFAWSAYDLDSICSLYYHFVLTNILDEQDGEPDIIDTIISTPYFSMNKALKPLSQYRWTVQAYNEYKIPSTKTISSTFTTGGVNDEGGISGDLKISSENIFADIDLIVLDKNKNPTGIETVLKKKPTTSLFEIHPLSPGTYLITAQCKKGSDFVADTIRATVEPGQVTAIGSITMKDETPPIITIPSEKDTIDFSDTLFFNIQDNSGEDVVANTIVYIGNRKVSQYSYEGKKLIVPTIESDHSWIPQLISVIATDGSGNTSTKTFIMRPDVFWFDTNGDTTISTQKPLTVFFRDHNPNSFIPMLFTITPVGNESESIIIDLTDEYFGEYLLTSYHSYNKEQEMITTITYSNGINQSKSWKLKLNEPPFMSYATHCVLPCESYIGTSAIFRWDPADDPEDDPLKYKLTIVRATDNTTSSSEVIFTSKELQGTQTIVSNLPEGPIFWWVEAKDPYGGVSSVWDTKGYAIVLSDEQLDAMLAEENTSANNTEGE